MKDSKVLMAVADSTATSVASGLFHTIIRWLALVLFVSNAFAQYVAKPQDFRIFNGKLYNVELSQLWKKTVRNVTEDCDKYQCEIWNNGIIVTMSKHPIVGSKREKSPYVVREVYINVPVKDTSRKITNGFFYVQYADKGIEDFTRLMPIGKTNYNGQEVDAYSIGLPNTAENRKTLVK